MTNLELTAVALESLIETWRSRLLEIDAITAHKKPSADRWSISEVVGHLVDSACNNHQRFVRAQFCEELQFPKYDQNQWAAAANYRHLDWSSLVQLWYHYNRMIAGLIRNIPAAKLQTPCLIVPYDRCTLEFLVTDYLDHMKSHFDKLSIRMDNEVSQS